MRADPDFIDNRHEFKTTANSSRQPRGHSENSIVQQPPKEGSFEHTETPSDIVSQHGRGKQAHSDRRSRRTSSSISEGQQAATTPEGGIIRQERPNARYDGESPMSVAKLGQDESTADFVDKLHEFKSTANSSRQPRGHSENSIVQQPPKEGSFKHTETPSAMVSQHGRGNQDGHRNLS
jgi:hypothetical protein